MYAADNCIGRAKVEKRGALRDFDKRGIVEKGSYEVTKVLERVKWWQHRTMEKIEVQSKERKKERVRERERVSEKSSRVRGRL